MSFRDFIHRHRHKVLPVTLLAVLAVGALIFWGPIYAWFTGAPIGGTRSDAVTAEAGPFRLEAQLSPDPPRQQDVTLHLRVTDAEGAAVEGAHVSVQYFMPAMGAMAEMKGDADIEEEGDGAYAAEFDLPMSGGWTLIVGVHAGDASGEARLGMTVGSKGLRVQSAQGTGGDGEPPRGPPVPELAAQELPGPVLAKLQTGLSAYEQIRELLAGDTLDGVDPHAEALAATLREAAEETEGDVASVLRSAAEAAAGVKNEDDIEVARRVFGDLSKFLVALAEADPRLAEGRFVFACPMADGFNKWIQTTHEMENPYMGSRMLACGERTEFSIEREQAAHDHAAANDEIAYYTCPMHPSVRQDQPGTCPICGMDLTPVRRSEIESGTILVDDDRRRRIGVKLAPVRRRQMVLPIRAVGEVTFDETDLHDVSLRMTGWVERLRVNQTGQRVRRGQVLFTLYSPELYAAQLEYLNVARPRTGPEAGPTMRATSDVLARTARQRLSLLGMPNAQIEELARRGEAWENVPVLSPASGYVIEKNVVEGAQVEAGTRVYRIADLDEVWIDAQVYESDLPHVRVGQEVEVTLPYVPGRSYEGRVDYVYPYLEDRTRTGKVRIVLPNPELELRPEMYANVIFQADLGERLVIPESAVLYTGPRRIVFVDLGGGRMRPQEVQLGARAGGFYEVLGGLRAGDVVVTSGNFLIASESRLKSAAFWSDEQDGERMENGAD